MDFKEIGVRRFAEALCNNNKPPNFFYQNIQLGEIEDGRTDLSGHLNLPHN
jgi:hypothetical protein